MVFEIPTVEHEADKIGDEILLVSIGEFREKIEIELFFFGGLAEFREHFINGLCGSFLYFFIWDGLKLLIESHSVGGEFDDIISFGILGGRL